MRHVNCAGYLLDRWLTQPELWQLEYFRITAEGQLHVQDAGPPERYV